MKRAFADVSSATITVPPVFNQRDVGSGIVASLSNIRDRQLGMMDAGQSMSQFQPSSWPGALPQWVPFSPQQQQLQPPQEQMAFMPGAVAGGDSCNVTSDPAQPTAQHQPGMVSAGSFGKFPLVGTLMANPISTQLSSSRIPLPEGQVLQAEAQQAAGEVTATVSISARADLASGFKACLASSPNTLPAAAAADSKGGLVVSDNLLSELQSQLQLRQDAAAQAGSWLTSQPPPEQQQQPCIPLDELQLLLPAVHAEYKAEMRLMLRACQVATSVTRHSTATGTTLLLDPSSRDQLQRQVLENCNDKHAAVATAFRQAAQAIEAAAAAAGCKGASAEGILSSKLLGAAASAEGLDTPAAAPPPPAAAAAAASGGVGAGMSWVWQCLQQLRSSYQQELVAATSALFAICRGFGQRYALSPAASASIKAALAAAQRQHGRVEQLWQDVVLTAGGA